jgi:hypothetical protein
VKERELTAQLEEKQARVEECQQHLVRAPRPMCLESFHATSHPHPPTPLHTRLMRRPGRHRLRADTMMRTGPCLC